MTLEQLEQRFSDSDLVLTMDNNRLVMLALDEQIKRLEKRVLEQAKLDPRYRYLLTVNGIDKILALTIMLETGDITRYEHVGNFASYCHCVGSQLLSNGKKKGSGNTKNGNRYLAWSFVEAANFAIRYTEPAKRKQYIPVVLSRNEIDRLFDQLISYGCLLISLISL